MDSYEFFSPEFVLRCRNEKKNIKRLGRVSGICIILYVIIQEFLSLPVAIFPVLREAYISDTNFSCAFIMITSVLSVLVPFGVGGMYIEKRTGVPTFRFNKPYDMKLAGTSIFFGVFICLAANFICSYFTVFAEYIGYELSSPDYDVPSSVFGRVVYVITIAVVPALCEEAAIRGAVLQPLRKYGDSFAIIISAVVFAVLHGNLVQAPFALIAGIGLGYIACITGSLWPGIIVHGLNNLYACVTEFMVADIADENTLTKYYYAVKFTLYGVTIAGSLVFAFIKRQRHISKPSTLNGPAEKFGAFMLNIPMIIALLIMLYITSTYITKV